MTTIRHFAFAGVLASVLYVWGTAKLDLIPRNVDPRELDALWPRSAQLLAATGDRYLAGNLATIRALMASVVRMTPDQFQLLARLHEDAARFHPANEDNYYVAANILPWNGQYAAAQRILDDAIKARPFDWLPVFYYGFDLWYFERRSAEAAAWIRKAMPRAKDEGNRIALEVIAVKWATQGYDTRTAIRLLEAAINQSDHRKLKDFYRMRVKRLEGLLRLEEAAQQFQTQYARPPRALSELVEAKLVDALPVDPWNFGYGLDAAGRPILFDSVRKQ